VSYPSIPRVDPMPAAAPDAAEQAASPAQPRLDLDPAGVQRIVWESRYGPILIEIVGDRVLVNGQPVEPASLPPRPAG
jgi:hypothetical protein